MFGVWACHAFSDSLQYRWLDTEWKEEPAEPISDEYDVFCT